MTPHLSKIMIPPNLFCYRGRRGSDPHAVKLTVSQADRSRFDALPHGPSSQSALVTDLNTGRRWRVRRADCGCRCYCAAQATALPQKP